MKSQLLLLIVLLLGVSCQSQEDAFANKFISTFKKGAINAEEIDWENFEIEVKKSLKSSKIHGIKKALTLYGNKHTFYSYKGQRLYGDFTVDSSPNPCYYSEGAFAHTIPENVGYINVPFLMISPDLSKAAVKVKATEYVEQLTNEIKNQDKKEIIGWVIDLRFNSGGNMWPMLLALRPFLTKGTLGYFIRGEEAAEWSYVDGDIKNGWNSSKQRLLSKDISYELQNKHKKIAVLIGNNTSSSGEAVAIALASIENMNYFGTNSSGYSTANQSFKMREGEHLILTTSVMADYQKKQMWDGIKLQESICNEAKLRQKVMDWMVE